MTKKPTKTVVQFVPVYQSNQNANINCCIAVEELRFHLESKSEIPEKDCACSKTTETPQLSFQKKLVNEIGKATFMVVKFMVLAFFINALLHFYVPQDFISTLLGGNGSFAVIIAAIVGVPVYTSNITALPLLSGLLALGMNKGAALAFLIAGPTTTLPAMVAVWGIVRRKIFILYVSFSLIGAIVFGLLYNLFG